MTRPAGTHLLEREQAPVRRLRLTPLALVRRERVLLVAKLLLRCLALAARLVEVGLVILNLGLELGFRVCAE